MKKKKHSRLMKVTVIVLSLVVMMVMTAPAMAADAAAASGNGVMLAKALPTGDNAMKISWAKYSGATKYVLMKAKCNVGDKKYSVKKYKTFNAGKNSYTVKGLKANTGYKFRVVAYNNSVKLAGSVIIHNFTSGSRDGLSSIKGIKVNKSRITLDKGQTASVKATLQLYSGKKAIGSNHAAKLRFKSSDKSVATVSKKGLITAKDPGTCSIYSIAVNGSWAKTAVTVNKLAATLTVNDDFDYEIKDVSDGHINGYFTFAYNGDGIVSAKMKSDFLPDAVLTVDQNAKRVTVANLDTLALWDNAQDDGTTGFTVVLNASEGSKYKAAGPAEKKIRVFLRD